MSHEAKPGLFWKHTEFFKEFLEDQHAKDEEFPGTLTEFEKVYQMRFVMSSEVALQKQVPFARGCYAKLPAMLQVWPLGGGLLGALPEATKIILRIIWTP
jgi:hypothetical protein